MNHEAAEEAVSSGKSWRRLQERGLLLIVLCKEQKQRGRVQELERARICSQITRCAELFGNENLGTEG